MRWLGHRLVADAELLEDLVPLMFGGALVSGKLAQSSLAGAHRIAHDAEHALMHAMPKLVEATIHAYPAHHPTREMCR